MSLLRRQGGLGAGGAEEDVRGDIGHVDGGGPHRDRAAGRA